MLSSQSLPYDCVRSQPARYSARLGRNLSRPSHHLHAGESGGDRHVCSTASALTSFADRFDRLVLFPAPQALA